jgi:DNA-binding FadR family transcriptional regulator
MAGTTERRAALGAKSAHRLAEEIERQIVARGWPVGENFGAESELAERFGVGRGVVRQAMTLVVRSGLAEVRRGRDGGLVVAAPTETAAATALRGHLDLGPVDLADTLLARRRFDELTLRLAIDRQDEADTAVYLELLEDHARAQTPRARLDFATRMLQALQAGARNPYLSLISGALVGLSWSRFRSEAETEQGRRLLAIAALRARQLRAIVGCDLGEALSLNGEIYRIYEELARGPELTDESRSLEHALAGRAAPEKLGEQIAQQIKGQIVRGDLTPGDRIGSEAELMTRYEASRGVVRDAIRILEHLSVATSMRGKGGGLYVTRPHDC